MASGLSIHIGVNYVDAAHYETRRTLPFCVNDATVMQTIAASTGFENYALHNEEATSHELFYFLSEAARRLCDGDILFISFSGHGGRFQDLNGDERNSYDEALLFFDRVVVDDELLAAWAQFKAGVRILFICDSCYSGSIIKGQSESPLWEWLLGKQGQESDALDNVYVKSEKLYNRLLKGIPHPSEISIEPSLLLLSACQEDQVASAGRESASGLSLFTEILVRCWSDGNFQGSYKDFSNQICREFRSIKSPQQPNYYLAGSNHPYFEHQIPFTI